MQRSLLLMPLLLVLSGSQLLAEEPKLTKAQLAIQGTWKVDQCYINGELEKWEFEYTFIKDNVTFVAPDQGPVTGKYALNSKAKPSHLDFTFPATKDHGILDWKGLYSLNKDRLVFCFHYYDGEKRPKELLDKPKAGFNVIILKR